MKKENKVCIFDVKCPFCKSNCFCLAADSYFWDDNFVKVECPKNPKHRFIVYKRGKKYIAKIVSKLTR
jgi:uncharacterized UPF0160 family protein